MSYIVITLIGMVTMAVGMLFFNMATKMISPRVATLISHAVILTVVFCLGPRSWVKGFFQRSNKECRCGMHWQPVFSLLLVFWPWRRVWRVVQPPRSCRSGGSYIVGTAILAVVFLDAPMNITKGIGIALTFLGIVLISLKG